MGLGYSCALCSSFHITRYGFRMHMLRVHDYRSTAHAKPGTGWGRRRRKRVVKAERDALWVLTFNSRYGKLGKQP